MIAVSREGREFAWGCIRVSAGLPEPLERFVRERLPSIEQVEIVLLLRREPDRSWTAPEVSERTGTPPESTAMRLFLLASNGIVAFEGSGVPKYRYTADPEVDAMVGDLEGFYARNREVLFDLLGTPARDPLRSFADAFKLKK